MRPRRRRRPLANASFLLVAITIAAYNASPTSTKKAFLLCSAVGSVEEGDDDDFLAEILAEQAREEEEFARLEAEAREFDAMKARQPSASSSSGGAPGGSGPKMGKMGGAGRTMPKGAAGANFSRMEEDLKKKEAESASKRAAREEEKSAADAERIRLKREAAFDADLKRMNQEQRKRAQRQKARDAKVVKRILKAHEAGRHYAVLGIRNLEVQLGPFYIFNFSIGPFRLFRVRTKEIKRIYRNLARTVHPDKNKDSRAEEAFHALETSAAVLTDEGRRSDYDKRIISARRRRNRYAVESAIEAGQLVWKKSTSALQVTKRVLGPFSTPILVIGALIV